MGLRFARTRMVSGREEALCREGASSKLAYGVGGRAAMGRVEVRKGTGKVQFYFCCCHYLHSGKSHSKHGQNVGKL